MHPGDTSAFIANAFKSQTYIADRIDVQQTPVYDTITVAAGSALTSGTQFFTNVGSSSGKNYSQTNMTQTQRLSSPESFSIQSIKLRISENILYADLITLINGFAFEFWLGQKNYQRAPIWLYPAGGGISGFSTVNANYAYNNGLPSREAQVALSIPIVIENGMTFYGQLVGTASYTFTASGSGGTGLTMQALLDGYYARGVQ